MEHANRDNKTVQFIPKNEELLEHAIILESGQSQEEEESNTGICIIPPLLTDHSKDSYPADYINYCRERDKRAKRNGIETPADIPEELLAQMEEATAEFNKMAEEATKDMEAVIVEE